MFGFDPNAWRWMSLAILCLTHPWAISDLLPSLKSASYVPPIPPKDTPPPQPTPIPTQSTFLSTFCTAIKEYEGWSPNTRSYRNNNPGNCRYSTQGYLAVYQPVQKDSEGFAVFKDYSTGWLYLQNLVRGKITKNPSWDFNDFFASYAPTTDNNNPTAYAKFVAARCQADTAVKLSTLLS